MMSILQGLLRRLNKSEKEARVICLGLDNAGKTTILKKLSDEDIIQTMPTQGFNIKSLLHDGFKLNAWDLGGQQSMRSYWRNYYDNADAIIFVIGESSSLFLSFVYELLS